MPYIFSALITLGLSIADISVLPRFSYYLGLPLLALPFIVIISLRDRSIFPIFLAFFAGLIYSSAAGNLIYVVVFLIAAVTAKLFFADSQDYNYIRSSLVLLAGTLVLMLAASWNILMATWRDPKLYLVLAIYLVGSLLLLPLYSYLGRKYFDYVDKYTAERYR